MNRSKAMILGAMACLPPLAVAQEQQEAMPGEVLVTAQRRVESVQDVPISVSVFTGAELEKSNINEAKSYLQFAPNVSFTEDGEVGNRGISISIRGVSDVSLGEVVTANSIGFYLDEFNVGTVANGVINPAAARRRAHRSAARPAGHLLRAQRARRRAEHHHEEADAGILG